MKVSPGLLRVDSSAHTLGETGTRFVASMNNIVKIVTKYILRPADAYILQLQKPFFMIHQATDKLKLEKYAGAFIELYEAQQALISEALGYSSSFQPLPRPGSWQGG